MRPYRSLLVLLLLATLGAVGWHALADDPGYLLLTFRGWSIETTLVVAALGLLLGGLLLALVVALLRAPLRLWRRQRQQSARMRLAQGLLALHDGRHAAAEKLLRRAAGDRGLRVPALLYASRAAAERGDQAQADALLEQASQAGGEIDAALDTAALLLQRGRAGTACELLEHHAREHSLPPRGIELRAEALTACGRSSEAVALLPELRRTRSREGDQQLALEARLLAAHLDAAGTPSELEHRWNALERGQRVLPPLVAAFADRMRRFGDSERAADAIVRAQDKQWSTELATLYGRLPHTDPRALKHAERWLAERPDDPAVLLCLGRLCHREQLWGKAEAYLGRAIALGAGIEAWQTLAEVFADQGDDTRARQAYANAVLVAQGEKVRPLLRLARPDEPAVAEERSSMGLPRLPAA